MGCPGDVAGDEDVIGHHTVDIEGAAPGITCQSPLSGSQLRAFQPLHIADGPQRGHHYVDVEHGSVRESRSADVAARVTFEVFHRNTGPQIHSCVAHHLCGDLTDHSAECAHQRTLTAFGHSHRQIQVAAHRGDLGTDETRTDDQHPLRTSLERGGQFGGVLGRANRVDAFQCGFLGVGPGACPRPGGDQQAAVLDVLTVGQLDHVVEPVQADSRHPQSPVGVHPTQPGQLGVVGGHPALEHLLGQRWAVIGLMRLIADDR